MPKIIDHEQRRRDVAEAAWRVLGRDGLLELSVRKVADEAGLATASLRRAFPTQDDLRTFCLEHAADLVIGRLEGIDPELPPREYCEHSLWELLPLDAARRLEMEVQMSLGALAFTNAALRSAYDDAHRHLAAGCRRLLTILGEDEEYRKVLGALEIETERLHALLDGLALHLVHTRRPESPEWALSALSDYLDGLRAQ